MAIKEFEQRHHVLVEKGTSRSHRVVNENSSATGRLIPTHTNYWPERPEKGLVWRMMLRFVAGHGKLKLGLSWKFPPE